MSLLKKLFTKPEAGITSYADFWSWYSKHAPVFFKVVKNNGNIEKDFFVPLSAKLNELKPGLFFLTGMYGDDTAELVLTADGAIKNIATIEELIAAAPPLPGWRFTALKPGLGAADVNIEMAGFQFNKDNLSFFSNDSPEHPDEIDITIVHNDFTEENSAAITNGVYIFLDNSLGELPFTTMIDNVVVTGKAAGQPELIPIEKLQAWLTWREKEFTEKHEDTQRNTEQDKYAMMEAQLQNGHVLLAVINTGLLKWDGKSSHPWIVSVQIKYDGRHNNGMPDKKIMALLEEVEDRILSELKDTDGNLNIGRQTAEGVREIYFACKDFRQPSKVLDAVLKEFAGRAEMSYEVYKDKYWRSFERFNVGE